MTDGWLSSEWDELFRGYTVGLRVAAYAGERPPPDPDRPAPAQLPLELKKNWDGLGFWDPAGVCWDVQTHLPLGTRSDGPEDADLWSAGWIDALSAIGEHVPDFPMHDANDVRVREVGAMKSTTGKEP